jgi:hypothetical protein
MARQPSKETRDFEGTEIRLTRRRHGSQYFCWLEVCIDGTWLDCGDPWPCRTPRPAEIRDAIRYGEWLLGAETDGFRNGQHAGQFLLEESA